MPTERLRPIASPVDTFAPAPVVLEDTGGSQLQQIGAALSQLNPTLQKHYSLKSEDDKREGLEEAYKFVHDQQLDNLHKWHRLQRNGELPKFSSPWAPHMTELLVTRRATAKALREVEIGLRSNPDFASGGRLADDIGALSNEFLSGVNDRVGELNGPQAQAVADMIGEAHESVLANHEIRRLGERRDEAMREINSGVKELFLSVVGDAQSPRDALQDLGEAGVGGLDPNALERLQKLLNSSELAYADPDAVAESAIEAITGLAVAARSVSFGMAMVDGLTVGGKPLADYVLPGWQATLAETVERKELTEMRNGQAWDAETERNRREALYNYVYTQTQQGAGSPGFDPGAIPIPTNIPGITPEDEAYFHGVTQDYQRLYIRELGLEGMDIDVEGGLLGDVAAPGARDLLLAMGPGGQSVAHTLLRLDEARDKMNNPEYQWGTSNSEAALLMSNIRAGKVSSEDGLLAMERLERENLISQSDYVNAYNAVLSLAVPGGNVTNSISNEMRGKMKSRIVYALQAYGLPAVTQDELTGDAQPSSEMVAHAQENMNRAQTEFVHWLEQNPESTKDEQEDKANELAFVAIRNTIANIPQTGEPRHAQEVPDSWDELNEAVHKQMGESAVEEQVLTNGYVTSFKNLSWENGFLHITGQDGVKRLSTTPHLMLNPDLSIKPKRSGEMSDLQSEYLAAIGALGIDDPYDKDAETFLRSQIQASDPSSNVGKGLRKVYELYRFQPVPQPDDPKRRVAQDPAPQITRSRYGYRSTPPPRSQTVPPPDPRGVGDFDLDY